jgi:potassium/hydrogen antiporter
MTAIDPVLLVGSALIILSIAVAKLSDRLGVPSLLLFLGIGMLAGSEGPGGIAFDNASLAQSAGILALVLILFSGGLSTRRAEGATVLWPAVSLATLGVGLTALAVGVFVWLVLDIPLMTGMLLGAVISSTDAAAVFAVLRARNIGLRGRINALLEVESGGNDPMAVFLTVGLIEFATVQGATVAGIALLFVVQMGVGAVSGVVVGRGLVFLLNRIRLSHEGLYPVLALAGCGLIYGATAAAGGSGFLAVYVAGLVAANREFIHKKSLLRFFDGLAWLSQIAMFLTLGLLVFPSHVVPVIGAGLLVSAFLIFVARPLSVFVSLAFSSFTTREKAFVSWVGLRGAAPIILATFPLLAGLPGAGFIFNVVFFIVVTSVMLQGWSMPPVARLLGVVTEQEQKPRAPIELAGDTAGMELVDLMIPRESAAAGKAIVDLGLPADSLIALVGRGENFFVPGGSTVLQEGDTILVLVAERSLPAVRAVLERRTATDGTA